MWMWLSTMKYCLPSFSYIYLPSYLAEGLQVEADVLGRVLRVGEHDDLVVEHDHAAVVSRHDLLEIVVAEVFPTEGLGALLVADFELPAAVDADHGGQLFDRDSLLAAHHLGDDVADLIVHQCDPSAIGGAAV